MTNAVNLANVASFLTSSGNNLLVNGMTVGRGGGEVSANTVVGTNALNANTTGTSNTAVGYQSAYSNTTGNNIVAVGWKAAYTNTTGELTAVGDEALLSNTTGDQNTAVGVVALTTNSTGNYNSAVGRSALRLNTTGANNTALGHSALYNNTTSNYNTCVGVQAGYTSNSADNIDAFGFGALYANTSGQQNAAIGMQSLVANTTGSYNVAVGKKSLQANTTGNNNTAIGWQSGYSSNSTGGTYLGYQTGYSTTSGTYNTFVGYQSGYLVTTGAKNVILGGYNGNQGGLNITTSSNYIVLSDGDGNPRQIIDNNGHAGIGLNPDSTYWLKVKGSSQFYNSAANTELVVGNQGDGIYYNGISIWAGYNGTYPMHRWSQDTNGSKYTVGGTLYILPASGAGGVYLTYGGTSWTANSDIRLKNIIEPISNPLQKVMGLESFIFSWKGDGTNKRCVGLSAQSVEAVLPEVISKSKNTADETDQTEYLGVQYTELIPVLTAAIQEQQAIIDQLTSRIAALEAKGQA